MKNDFHATKTPVSKLYIKIDNMKNDFHATKTPVFKMYMKN